MRARATGYLSLAVLVLAGSFNVSAAGQTVPGAEARAFTVSPLTGFPGPSLEVLLYNPPAAEVPWKAPDKPEATKRKIDAVAGERTKGLHLFSQEAKCRQYFIVSRDPFPRKLQNGIQIIPWQQFCARLWQGDIF